MYENKNKGVISAKESILFTTSGYSYTHHFELRLDLAKFSPSKHLYVRRDLLSRPRLACSQFDITGNQLVPT